jgi:2-polyprenyl-3-methyl-5-hydroxy-6-metoxy-1,4-benzoquinol methylase
VTFTQLVVESLRELKRIPLRIRDINNAIDRIEMRIVEIERYQREVISTHVEDIRSGVIQIQLRQSTKYDLRSAHRLADQSNDHIEPWGTKNDNTRSPRFVAACERQFGNRKLAAMDLGCSGGGLVFDFLLTGHSAVGLEGSDYSFEAKRAEWKFIPGNLFTCDITKPFSVVKENSDDRESFDIISAWEVMEHIREVDLPQLFSNINNHLSDQGVFVGSIALYDDIVNGISYHPTVRPREWWEQRFLENGLRMSADEYGDFLRFADYCRGTGNGPMDPDFSKTPDQGFHFIARKLQNEPNQGLAPCS